MRTLVTADLHATDNPRDSYRWRFIEEKLPELIKQCGLGRVLMLGDFTEQKTGHSAGLVNRLVDAVAAIAELAQVYMLKGNHDYLAEDVPFYRFARHIPRVRWINDPTALRLRGLGSCLFLPHTPRPSEDWKPLLRDDYDWFFCHQTFGGADLGGHAAAGAPPPFSRGARVVSGDVHKPQRVGPVTYVGAPYAVDFGDAYSPRVLLLEDERVESIPVDGPQKVLVDGSRGPGGITARTGDVVKVRVEVPRDCKESRAAIRAKWRAWADAQGVMLHAVEICAPKALLGAGKAAEARGRSSDAELVRRYAKRAKAGKATLAAGLKLMEAEQ